jgi:hypothetical protein
MHLVDPNPSILDTLFTNVNTATTLIYIALSPLSITPSHLKPSLPIDSLVATLTPPQTYLHIGSQTLDFSKDINSSQGVLLIESDTDYMRRDAFTNLNEILEAVDT